MKNLSLKIASAFACISYELINVHKEDLFYELPKCLDALFNKEYFVLLVRSTGADGLDRFLSCLDESTDKTYANAIDYAKCTLGVDYAVWFDLHEDDLRLTFRADKEELPYGLTSALDCRGIRYEFIRCLK